MKLYYVTGACSLATHIMLHEVGADFETELVDTVAGRTESGQFYRDISPNGYVPALEIAGGEYLSEGVAILQYIADTNPAHAFSPQSGSIARARLQQFLNYASSEFHKAWGPLFSESSNDEQKNAAITNIKSKFDYLESVLSDGRDYFVENRFSVADAYIFVVANWANFKAIDLTPWPRLAAFMQRIAARPSAQAAMRAEGILS